MFWEKRVRGVPLTETSFFYLKDAKKKDRFNI